MKNLHKQLAGARVASKTQLPIRRFAAKALAIMAVILTSMYGAWADTGTTYTVNETLASFGTINQINVSPTDGEMSCVPTATMNSFIFLQTEYQSIFGNDGLGAPALQGEQGSWVNAAALLAGANYMNTAQNNGTTIKNWIGGKVSYLNTYANGLITFNGMDSLSAPADRLSWDTDGNPTVNFLLKELQANEDVELGIYPDKSDVIGHALTLTGLTWIDADNSKTFDLGDTLTLDIMDPANPMGNTPLLLKPGDPMTISGGPYNNYVLEVALSESPVPEPATASLLLLGVGALLGGLRLRRRSS
jgi:hypothetical protein